MWKSKLDGVRSKRSFHSLAQNVEALSRASATLSGRAPGVIYSRATVFTHHWFVDIKLLVLEEPRGSFSPWYPVVVNWQKPALVDVLEAYSPGPFSKTLLLGSRNFGWFLSVRYVLDRNHITLVGAMPVPFTFFESRPVFCSLPWLPSHIVFTYSTLQVLQLET